MLLCANMTMESSGKRLYKWNSKYRKQKYTVKINPSRQQEGYTLKYLITIGILQQCFDSHVLSLLFVSSSQGHLLHAKGEIKKNHF